MPFTKEDSDAARRLVDRRWHESRTRKILDYLAKFPLTPEEADKVRALLPPARTDGER